MLLRLLAPFLILPMLWACSDASPAASAHASSPRHRSLPRYDAELLFVELASQDPDELDKYRDGPFIVTGRLQKIHADGPELQLDLKAADPEHPVRARLKADGACSGANCPEPVALDTLPRGFKVYLECTSARLDAGLPTVNGCVLTDGPG
ncbi:hypothetical protein PIGHUM_03429 [Pigmentiphaga humi]|uniref:Lipoprotein n=1 Tax=Pigmentiphaga humi TaxID=2478468 RepID=A0A3P4B6R4_9BURK|nr:hypothetical protein [Pigmentiphaga humi]VCU71348.1 hypothetical protein PIGHUM_03429 [Pigmentiphaga humi]